MSLEVILPRKLSRTCAVSISSALSNKAFQQIFMVLNIDKRPFWKLGRVPHSSIVQSDESRISRPVLHLSTVALCTRLSSTGLRHLFKVASRSLGASFSDVMTSSPSYGMLDRTTKPQSTYAAYW